MNPKAAANQLAALVKRGLNIEVEPDALATFIEKEWPFVSFYAHSIHQPPSLNPSRD